MVLINIDDNCSSNASRVLTVYLKFLPPQTDTRELGNYKINNHFFDYYIINYTLNYVALLTLLFGSLYYRVDSVVHTARVNGELCLVESNPGNCGGGNVGFNFSTQKTFC